MHVSNIFNSLPANIADADRVNAFKNGLDRLCRLKNMFDVDFDFQDSYTKQIIKIRTMKSEMTGFG